MGSDFDKRYECRQYTSEYLFRSDSVVEHASKLFSAGRVKTVFPVDVSDTSPITTALVIILSPLAMLSKPSDPGDPNPHVPFYRSPADDRNKLVAFKKWLVRCTYQQYDAKLGKELFYFIGAPLEHIKNVSFTSVLSH